MIRKDSLTEPNTSNMLSNTNINTELSNYSSTKKKSLKTTLYRIFTQRKKSNFNTDIILINPFQSTSFFKFKSLEHYKKIILNFLMENILTKTNSLLKQNLTKKLKKSKILHSFLKI
jgi:hypothetical protein